MRRLGENGRTQGGPAPGGHGNGAIQGCVWSGQIPDADVNRYRGAWTGSAFRHAIFA